MELYREQPLTVGDLPGFAKNIRLQADDGSEYVVIDDIDLDLDCEEFPVIYCHAMDCSEEVKRYKGMGYCAHCYEVVWYMEDETIDDWAETYPDEWIKYAASHESSDMTNNGYYNVGNKM